MRSDTGDHRIPRGNPSICASCEYNEILATWTKPLRRHARPRSGLANKRDRSIAGQIVNPQVNLFQRNIHRARDVPSRIFRRRAHINRLPAQWPPLSIRRALTSMVFSPAFAIADFSPSTKILPTWKER